MTRRQGFTLLELLVVVLMFSIISTAGFMLFMAGESLWSVASANVHIQDNLRRVLQRIAAELQESGTDSVGVLRVTIFNNTGTGGSDILRFAAPVCPCFTKPIDSNGDVQYWGAPVLWGRSGCKEDYPVDVNNKVTICHLPPGNPNNPQTLSVNVNAVQSHLAHGDWIGDCNACDPANYTNRFVEYRMDANNQLVRRVLNNGLAVVNEVIIADSLTDFQAVLNAGQTAVNVSAALSRQASQNRVVAMTDSVDVLLRN